MARFYEQDIRESSQQPLLLLPAVKRAVLKVSWPSHSKRSLEQRAIRACSGEFGAPKYIAGSLIRSADGVPVTNSLFMPADKDIAAHHWAVFSNTQGRPPHADVRAQVWLATGEVAELMTTCKDGGDVLECMLHGALGMRLPNMNNY